MSVGGDFPSRGEDFPSRSVSGGRPLSSPGPGQKSGNSQAAQFASKSPIQQEHKELASAATWALRALGAIAAVAAIVGVGALLLPLGPAPFVIGALALVVVALVVGACVVHAQNPEAGKLAQAVGRFGEGFLFPIVLLSLCR